MGERNMIIIKNWQRKHELVNGSSAKNAEELAFLVVHLVDDYLIADETKDDLTGVLGAIELAKSDILRRKK